VGCRPTHDAENQLGAADQRSSPDATARPIRVVLVDDVPVFRDLVRLLLAAEGGFEVVAEACDGLEAIRVCSEEQPDAVVLDLAMPELGGLEAIPQIRACSPGTSVVVMSAFARNQLERASLASGAHAYLEKGDDVSDIAATIGALVNISRTASLSRA
jgi:two-component system nitrate/nitrite response regulator NarL